MGELAEFFPEHMGGPSASRKQEPVSPEEDATGWIQRHAAHAALQASWRTQPNSGPQLRPMRVAASIAAQYHRF
jgi:hypothetical protein